MVHNGHNVVYPSESQRRVFSTFDQKNFDFKIRREHRWIERRSEQQDKVNGVILT